MDLPLIGVWTCGFVDRSNATFFKQTFPSVNDNDTESTERGFDCSQVNRRNSWSIHEDYLVRRPTLSAPASLPAATQAEILTPSDVPRGVTSPARHRTTGRKIHRSVSEIADKPIRC